MINARTAIAVTLLSLGILSAAGCSAPSHAPAASPSAGTSKPVKKSTPWTAPCNLAFEWDASVRKSRAVYAAPTLGEQFDSRQYEELIANSTCSDALMLQWQEVREAAGEPSRLCRIAWGWDVGGLWTVQGCAVPAWAVRHAIR